MKLRIVALSPEGNEIGQIIEARLLEVITYENGRMMARVRFNGLTALLGGPNLVRVEQL
jgi:hypothetical protein